MQKTPPKAPLSPLPPGVFDLLLQIPRVASSNCNPALFEREHVGAGHVVEETSF